MVQRSGKRQSRTPGSNLGVVLIAHGSRVPQANQELHAVAAELRRRGYARIYPSFLELAEPDIISAGDRCVLEGAEQVVLAPYFLSMGRHVTQDLEAARADLARRHPRVEFRLASPLGPHSLLERILVERIEEQRPCGETTSTMAQDD